MNLHHLRIFLAVADTGSISAGAQRLHISQPAVTREIREFEASLGLALFDRRPRGVALTEGGRRLLPYAQRIFALDQAAERDLGDFVRLASGELRLGASATLSGYLLPGFIADFQRQHPQVFIDLKVSNTRHVARQLDDRQIDLGFVEGAFDHQAHAWHRLAFDRLLPVVGPGHPLAGRTGLTAQDLAGQPLYLREPGSGARASVEQAYRDWRIDAPVRMALGSTEALKRVIQGGTGLAWLSERVVERALADGRLVRLDLGPLSIERALSVLWRRDEQLSPVPAAFLQPLLGEAPANIKSF